VIVIGVLAILFGSAAAVNSIGDDGELVTLAPASGVDQSVQPVEAKTFVYRIVES
jgi:hypothetical protein